jgi:hypothetical protein
MDVSQLEQLQTLRHQQAMLTEQSQAVRKLLQEYDAIDAAQSAANTSAFESFWATPELSGRLGSADGRAPTTHTLKSLCDKQRRTAQVLKAMSGTVNSTTAVPLSASADRRVVVTLEDVKETARLPPNSNLIENVSGRLPSQIKLQALLKEQSKQLAETHAKYKTAHKGSQSVLRGGLCCSSRLTSCSPVFRSLQLSLFGDIGWRMRVRSADCCTRPSCTTNDANSVRYKWLPRLICAPLWQCGTLMENAVVSVCMRVLQTLHRCRWFVALKKHARQCEITVLVNHLDKGWERFHRRFVDRKRRLAMSEQAKRRHLHHTFKELRSRLKRRRRRAILGRAATHAHLRAAWRRFAGVLGRKLKLRHGLQQSTTQKIAAVQFANKGASPAGVLHWSTQPRNAMLLLRALQVKRFIISTQRHVWTGRPQIPVAHSCYSSCFNAPSILADCRSWRANTFAEGAGTGIARRFKHTGSPTHWR